jgi:LPXTG-site transpeptidase (sortase) family protein
MNHYQMDTPNLNLDKSPKTRNRLITYLLGILLLGVLFLIPISVSYAQEAGKLRMVQRSSSEIGDSSLKQTFLLTDTVTVTPTITITVTLTPTSTITPTITPTPTESATPSPTPTETSTSTTTSTVTRTVTSTATSTASQTRTATQPTYTTTPSPSVTATQPTKTSTVSPTITGTQPTKTSTVSPSVTATQPTKTSTVSPSVTATQPTNTSTASPTITGTQPTKTSTVSPTVTGTITPVPTIKVSVTPAQAKVNESFTFTIEAGNKGIINTQNNIVFDSFPTYIDVMTITTSRGTITKLTHSFVVTIGDMVPNEKITIIATVKVNSTLTHNEVTSNLVTLAYNDTKSITASVNYTAVYQTLPGTGELPLNWRDSRLKPASLIPGILLLGLGAGMLLIGIWLKVRDKRNSYWMIAIGSLLIIVGFIAGINASGVLASSQQANDQMTSPTSSGILAQIHPVEITETGLPRLPASAFSTPEASIPVVTLPDYPIPTPVITITPQPGAAEPDISPVVRIVIPGISLDTEVKYVPYDGFTWLINGLRQEVAWMGNTSWPGLGGNTALAGHVTVAGLGNGPFRHLDELLAGEVVILYTEKNMYTYNVRESRVTDDGDMSVTLASENPQITLITCTDWDKETQTYLKRLVVFADLIRTEPITMGSIP